MRCRREHAHLSSNRLSRIFTTCRSALEEKVTSLTQLRTCLQHHPSELFGSAQLFAVTQRKKRTYDVIRMTSFGWTCRSPTPPKSAQQIAHSPSHECRLPGHEIAIVHRCSGAVSSVREVSSMLRGPLSRSGPRTVRRPRPERRGARARRRRQSLTASSANLVAAEGP